ncbi:MAG: hypothetical protein ACRDLF_03920 [Solirubrobacteraceae bacterium]
MELRTTAEQGDREGRAPCRRSVLRGKRRAFCVAGLLALVLVAVALSSAGLALAVSPLSWSSPTLIDAAPPEPILDGVSCILDECVAVDEFGNVLASTDVTSGSPIWSVSDVDGSAELLGVSCTVGPLCVAVDGAGDVVVSTHPTSGAGDWSVAHVDGSRALLGVSCVSGPLCVAVDNAGDVLTSTDPTGGEHGWAVTHLNEEVIHAVSCATASLCVAVENNGNVIASTEPTNGEHAWTPAHIDGERSIFDVSCPSTSLCVAVDLAGDVLTSSKPAGGAGTWTVTEVDEHALGAISCSSPSSCVAVDSVGHVLTSAEPAGGKSAWAATHIDPGEYLFGVSCTSSLCAAVNGYGDVFTATDPGGGAGSWTNTHIDSSNPASILGVSCASTTLCLAVDNAHDVLISTEPTNTHAWVTTGSHERGGGTFRAVACPSASVCLAAEEYGVYTSDPTGKSPDIWTQRFERPFPEILDPGVEYLGPLASISCASATFCIANLDSFNDFDRLASSTDPASAWHAVVGEGRIVGSGNHRPPPNQYDDPILGVSCASESLCVAVDAAGNTITSTDPASSGSMWTIAPVETQPIWGISCPSSSLCVAIDHAGDVLTTTDPTTSTPSWTITDADGTNHLIGISCASESLCVAVDAAGNVLSSTDPAGGPGAWSVVPADPGHTLTSVSCTPAVAGLCVAVDNAGYAVTSTFSPQTEGGRPGGESGGGQTGGTTTSLEPSLPPPVVGVFRVLSAKVGRDGQIVLTFEAPAAGSIDARATVSIRKAAGSSKRKTKRTRKVTYGTGSAFAPGIDTMTVTIKPTKSALGALKSSRTLRVPVTILFHPRSGSPTTVSETVTVRYLPPRRARACSASRGACRGSHAGRGPAQPAVVGHGGPTPPTLGSTSTHVDDPQALPSRSPPARAARRVSGAAQLRRPPPSRRG